MLVVFLLVAYPLQLGIWVVIGPTKAVWSDLLQLVVYSKRYLLKAIARVRKRYSLDLRCTYCSYFKRVALVRCSWSFAAQLSWCFKNFRDITEAVLALLCKVGASTYIWFSLNISAMCSFSQSSSFLAEKPNSSDSC